jgi:hypothetical protein
MRTAVSHNATLVTNTNTFVTNDSTKDYNTLTTPATVLLQILQVLRCRTAALPHSRTAALPHCRTAALPHCRTAALPHCRTAALPRCRPGVEKKKKKHPIKWPKKIRITNWGVCLPDGGVEWA